MGWWVSLLHMASAVAQPGNNKVLFVIVDGISAEQLARVPTPNLDAIAGGGGYTPAYVGGEVKSYSQTPTISAVGYNSLLTGTWVNKHNVWDNTIKAPNYYYWTLFRFFKEAYPARKTAVFSTWQDNRTKLIGEKLLQTGFLRLDYTFDGFELDTVRFRPDPERTHIHRIDELVVDEASRYLQAKGPDMSWVYLQYTDDMGHRYGNSEPFYKAIGLMDVQIGRLWKAVRVREQQFGENWEVYITTDHGRIEADGQSHGGQSAGERSTWIVTNARNLNAHFNREITENYKPAIVDILPSIARHMQLEIPKEQLFELDGIPLTGKISVAAMKVTASGDTAVLTWKAVEREGTVKIWLATTNHFEEGGQDHYQLVDEVAVSEEAYTIDLLHYPSRLYKFVLEGNENTVNKWLVRP